MRNSIFLLTSLCLIVSCSPKPKSGGDGPETVNITNDDFKSHQLTYEVLPVEIIDYVWSIHIRDSVAYFLNMAGDEIVSIYDLKNSRRLGSAIKKGQGPNELLMGVWRIQINADKGFAGIYDPEQRKFMAFPLEVLTRVATGDTNRFFKPIVVFKFENSNSDMSALDTNAFVGICSDLNTNNRLRFYDSQGNITAEKGGFYRTPEMTFPEDINWHAFDARVVCRDDGKRMVVANMHTDRLEIYDGQGDLSRLVKGPDHFAPDVMEIKSGGIISYGYGEKARSAYIFPLAKKEGFWAIYRGYTTYKERKESTEPKFTVIMSFDWDGKPLDKYIIQADITNFDVDESKGLIYGIMMTEEGEQKIVKSKYR